MKLIRAKYKPLDTVTASYVFFLLFCGVYPKMQLMCSTLPASLDIPQAITVYIFISVNVSTVPWV